MTLTTLTIHIREDLADRLAKLAAATDRPRSYLAAQAVEEYLALQEWQVEAIGAGIAAADRGEGTELSEVRAAWEKKLAASLR